MVKKCQFRPFHIFFEKPLHTSNSNLYNSGLFGRNDKRQTETSE